MSSEDFVASDWLIVFLHLKPLNQAAQMREKDGLSQENLFVGEVWLNGLVDSMVYVLYIGGPPKIWVFTPQIHHF